MSPGGPPLGPEAWAALVEGWFPHLVDRSVRQSTWPDIAIHHEQIKAWLGQVHVSTIHQRLRVHSGELGQSIQSKVGSDPGRRPRRLSGERAHLCGRGL